MAERDADRPRWQRCRRACRTMMWGFLFFLPLPVPVFKVLPDPVGWLLLAAGLVLIIRLRPTVQVMGVLCVAGLGASVVRTITVPLGAGDATAAQVALCLAPWAILLAVTLLLGRLLGGLAATAGADTVARSAATRSWLPALPLAALACFFAVPDGLELTLSIVYVVSAVGAVSFLMGMMAGAARMCEQAADMRLEPAPAEPELPGQ
jgi:hypothetical protein